MMKKQSGIERDYLSSEAPPFICQDRQCTGPMMVRVYVTENPHSPEDRGEFEDLRENIPVNKKIPLDGPDRIRF